MPAPRWRVWTYDSPAIVLGCSQRHLRDQLEPRVAGPCAVLDRESGGGAVLTGPWLLGLSVVLPPAHAWLAKGLLESYRHLGELHAQVLAGLGVSATALPPSQLPAHQSALAAAGLPVCEWACFGNLSPWEVVDAQGRKLVGLAQRKRQHGTLLVAGTLLSAPDWDLLCAALGRPQDAALLRQRTVSCEEMREGRGQPVTGTALAEALEACLARALS